MPFNDCKADEPLFQSDDPVWIASRVAQDNSLLKQSARLTVLVSKSPDIIDLLCSMLGIDGMKTIASSLCLLTIDFGRLSKASMQCLIEAGWFDHQSYGMPHALIDTYVLPLLQRNAEWLHPRTINPLLYEDEKVCLAVLSSSATLSRRLHADAYAQFPPSMKASFAVVQRALETSNRYFITDVLKLIPSSRLEDPRVWRIAARMYCYPAYLPRAAFSDLETMIEVAKVTGAVVFLYACPEFRTNRRLIEESCKVDEKTLTFLTDETLKSEMFPIACRYKPGAYQYGTEVLRADLPLAQDVMQRDGAMLVHYPGKKIPYALAFAATSTSFAACSKCGSSTIRQIRKENARLLHSCEGMRCFAANSVLPGDLVRHVMGFIWDEQEWTRSMCRALNLRLYSASKRKRGERKGAPKAKRARSATDHFIA